MSGPAPAPGDPAPAPGDPSPAPAAAPARSLAAAPTRGPRRVSVVVPVRNGAATLGDALERLVAERPGVPWEVVVADNGSADATRSIAEAIAARTHDDPGAPAVRVVDAGGRPGPAHARNAGAGTAAGDLLCFTDADDLVEPGWLAALVAAAPGHHAVAGRLDVDTINPADARAWRPRPLTARAEAPPFAPSGNVAIWDEVFAALGGFDEALLANEDVELSERLLSAGGVLGWAPDAVVHYRLRTTAAGIARQSFRSGWFAVQVAARRGATGSATDPAADSGSDPATDPAADPATGARPAHPGPALADVARRLGWLALRLPYLAVRRRRGLWVHHGAALAGEVAGAAAVRTRRWSRRLPR